VPLTWMHEVDELERTKMMAITRSSKKVRGVDNKTSSASSGNESDECVSATNSCGTQITLKGIYSYYSLNTYIFC
jgi:hypothetical protein